ncbi:Os07g0589466 [Oryza sativa Japonica Group]|uniref:Os07g0589466 protein n=1 Tax=Oryza sativa subsp. japonica TaxID=39947 RepID=A0A0P0X877_ORYSJ|nr:Os07g0589466 [Oryza sativa Japonica Group]
MRVGAGAHRRRKQQEHRTAARGMDGDRPQATGRTPRGDGSRGRGDAGTGRWTRGQRREYAMEAAGRPATETGATTAQAASQGDDAGRGGVVG